MHLNKIRVQLQMRVNQMQIQVQMHQPQGNKMQVQVQMPHLYLHLQMQMHLSINLLSDSVYCYESPLLRVTMGVDTSRRSHLTDFVGHAIGALSCFLLLANIMLTVGTINVLFSLPNYAMYCQYNESVHRKEQLATLNNTIQ